MSDLILGVFHLVDFGAQTALDLYERLTESDDSGDEPKTDESDGNERCQSAIPRAPQSDPATATGPTGTRRVLPRRP